MTSPAIFLDFFPESTLGDGPKNSRIRVNSSLKPVRRSLPLLYHSIFVLVHVHQWTVRHAQQFLPIVFLEEFCHEKLVSNFYRLWFQSFVNSRIIRIHIISYNLYVFLKIGICHCDVTSYIFGFFFQKFFSVTSKDGSEIRQSLVFFIGE